MSAVAPVRVETGGLDERRRVLDRLSAGLAGCAALGEGVVVAVRLADPGRAGEAAVLGERLRGLEAEAAALRDALEAAAAGYERAEEGAAPELSAVSAPEAAVAVFGRRAGESLARRLPGAVEDAAVLVRAVADAAFGSASAAVRALAGDESARADLEEEGEDLVRALLGDPLVIEGLRGLISWIGLGTEIGVLLLPPQLAEAVGRPSSEQVIGEGVASAAGALVVLGTLFGVLPAPGEREVRVERVAPPAVRTGSADAPPTGWGELAARIPPSDPDGPQVVIERFGAQWLVTLSGTTDWSADPEQAFGAASNLQAMSGRRAASVDGALAAMAAAGIPPGAPVTLAAHSQGGLVALRIAQSGRYDVHDVVTFGSPVRGLDLPDGTRSVSIEHSDDLVPALGGFGRTSGEEPGVVLIERDSPAGTPRESPVPAHGLEAYVATARELDVSADPRLAAAGAALFPLWRGAPGERFAARLTTVPVSPGGGRGRRDGGAVRGTS
ncbi:hypothetical protein HQQ82_11700 [Rathayibacter sp. VKM Ac-2856]|uniref:alpha/beta hydrolase n=1 Tax=unclassified Rathayibacter TaxID=2609250 RepID=UPI0015674138|nr:MULTISPECIES: alpha/beta hydrolase [unclassified Rathayibacter]NQX05488.1 hypothetical protein [Rathayibacter sp. VKM Ac-2858]NQX20637.1 hypothetical protein [Rathayibacter sp. VKM Ac-2856]